MYTLRGFVHSCWSSGAFSVKLLSTNQIAKIHYKVISRCLTTGHIPVEKILSKHQQQKPVIQHKRTLMKHSLSSFIPKYDEDKVPRDFELIYEATLANTHVIAFFCLGAFILLYGSFMAYLCLLFTDNWTFEEQTVITGTDMTVSTLGLKFSGTVLCFVIFWLFYGIRYARLPVQRIYQSPNHIDFIGILKSGVFKTERVEFNLSEVIGLSPGAKRGKTSSNAIVKGRECLIYASDFKIPEQFNHILGFKQ